MKRFTSTEKWSTGWHFTLTPSHKLAWACLNDLCDHAGVIETADALIAQYIGDVTFTIESFADVAGTERIRKIGPNRWWLPKYIEFQNAGGISAIKKQHQPAIRSIMKNQLPILINHPGENSALLAHNEWVANSNQSQTEYPSQRDVLGKNYLNITRQGTGTGKGTEREEGVGEEKTNPEPENRMELFSEPVPVKTKAQIKAKEIESAFDAFWEIMPNKTDKLRAKKAFEQQAKSHDPWDIVRRTARYLAKEQARQKTNPEAFIPQNPHNWLIGGGFLSDPSHIPTPPKKLLHAAWTASGRNGSGPPPWEKLATDSATINDMRRAFRPLDLLLDGVAECVKIVTGMELAS
ncbi:hypothetical protein EBZ80_10525 [bacterium]|nr:hypothetical protein [bacterium]